MNFNSEYEKLFFNLCMAKPKYLSMVKKGYYTSKEIDNLSQLAGKFYAKFKETPSSEQMKLLIDHSKVAKEAGITRELVSTIYDVDLKEFDAEWLETTAEAWIKWRTFDTTLLDTMEYVQTNKVTPDNVDTIISKVKTLINERNNLNFNTDLGLDFFDPESHNQLQEDKISSGYNVIDAVTHGGYDRKSLVVYAGEQNIGKSIFLANDAVNFVRRGHNVAVISAEMSGHKFVKRIGANALNIPMSEYAKKAKDKGFIKRRLDTISDGLLPPGQLHIKHVPTSQFTVLDCEAYLKELEELKGIKLHVIVIDYINILSNYRNPNSDNTYMKVKQIAEDLRAMAIRNDWLIITATQINRDGYDSTEITMNNIAESAGLSHTADMMYAIIQDRIMYESDPPEYWLKILKIRDGEGKNKRFKLTIDYEYMRLTETEEEWNRNNDD